MTQYCHCGSKTTLDPDDQDYYPLDRKSVLFWVCGVCGKPSHVVQPEEPDMFAPMDAKQIRDVMIDAHGISHVTWQRGDRSYVTTIEYFPYPRRMSVDQGREHLLNMWKMLDAEVATIRTVPAAEQEYAKARAGAIADVIYILMSGFYADRQAVTREALARYDAKVAGTPHESPGLAEIIWNPDARFENTHYSVENEERVRSGKKTAVATGNQVPEGAVATAKAGIEAGMFTVKQMAETYKMSEAELKAQLQIA